MIRIGEAPAIDFGPLAKSLIAGVALAALMSGAAAGQEVRRANSERPIPYDNDLRTPRGSTVPRAELSEPRNFGQPYAAGQGYLHSDYERYRRYRANQEIGADDRGPERYATWAQRRSGAFEDDFRSQDQDRYTRGFDYGQPHDYGVDRQYQGRRAGRAPNAGATEPDSRSAAAGGFRFENKGYRDRGQHQPRHVQLDASNQRQAQQGPAHFTVAPADKLVGRSVAGMDGQELGKLEFIMIDAQTGAVRYGLISTQSGGDGFIAVPWSAMKLQPGSSNKISFTGDRNRLGNAPRITRARLAELTRPAMVAQITDYYAPVAQGQAAGQTNQQGSAQGQQSGSPSPSGARPQQQGAAGQSGMAQQGAGQAGQAQTGKQSSSQAGTQGQQPATPSTGQQQRAEESGSTAGSTDQAGVPHVLIGREIVTMLAPPPLVAPSQLTGIGVVADDGWYVGEIDKLMIDVERGQVAYALLARNSGFGTSQTWLPVPYQSLHWSPQLGSYEIEIDTRQLQATPILTPGDMPGMVRVNGAEVSRLYRLYDVAPYWRQAANTQGGQQNQSGSQNESGQQQNRPPGAENRQPG